MNNNFEKKFIIPEGSNLQEVITACSNVGSLIVAKTFDEGACLLTLDRFTTCNNFFDKFISEYDSDYYRADYDDDDDDDYEYDEDDLYICNEGSEIGCSADECDDEYDDYDDDDEECCEEDVVYYSKDDHINAITVLLGKLVAQELVLGQTYDNSAHILSLIDEILFSMSSCGFFGLDLVFNDEHREKLGYSGKFRQNLGEEFDKVIAYCYNRAKVILTANIELIRNLIPKTTDWDMYDDEDLNSLLSELGGITYVEYRGK